MSEDNSTEAQNGQFAALISQLRNNPRLPLIVGIAIAATVLVGIFLWSSSPDYGVLFSGLSDQDGGAIVSKLDQMNEPYKFSAGGNTILIPKADVDRVRLKLASKGLPKSGGVGYELMDNEPLGISKFAEHVNYHRALQGELARSIETISTVSSARVNLAMPKSSVFVRKQKKPKASVIVTLYAGRALSGGQVSSIQHLVSSSVPRLPVNAVTIVNSDGDLLSKSHDNAAGADTSQLKYVARVEKAYKKKIHSILAPIVGSDNFRVQVNAAMDFSSQEKTHEQYDPNQGDHSATIRSEERNARINSGPGGKGGIPGALSNQPSPDQTSPINNPTKKQKGNNGDNTQSGTNQNTNTQSDSASKKQSITRSSTTNYELNHTIEHIKQPVGRLKQISAAVVINDKRAENKTVPAMKSAPKGDNNGMVAANTPATDKSGKSGKSEPRFSKTDMQHIRRLVRAAIGYSVQRGDSVAVIRAPFTGATKTQTLPRPPWWQNAQLQAMGEKVLKYLILVLAAWLLWAKLVKPLIERTPGFRLAPAAAGAGAAQEPPEPDDEEARAEKARRDAEARKRRKRVQQHNDLLGQTQEMAKNDPRMVAMIIKSWMNRRG